MVFFLLLDIIIWDTGLAGRVAKTSRPISLQRDAHPAFSYVVCKFYVRPTNFSFVAYTLSNRALPS